MATTHAGRCLACERSDAETPLISLVYRGNDLWICPQHMPVLIHHSEQLLDKLASTAGQAPRGKME